MTFAEKQHQQLLRNSPTPQNDEAQNFHEEIHGKNCNLCKDVVWVPMPDGTHDK